MKDNSIELEELAPWLAIVITLFGFGLRVLLLANKGLRMEETFSLWLTDHTIADMLQWIVKVDHNPPLYYLLLHYWTALEGESVYNLRLLSALFGAATIPMVYLIGKRLSGFLVGLLAALFLALSPFNIRFAQEAHMYTLLAFNAALALYALVILLTDPRSSTPIGSQFRAYIHAWRTQKPLEPGAAGEFSYKEKTHPQTGLLGWIYRHRWLPIKSIETDLAWIAFIVFSAATLFSHNTAIFFAIAANAFVLGLMLYQRIRKSGPPAAFWAPSFWNWVIAQIAILILWSPWIAAFIKQARGVYQDFWIPRPGPNNIVQVLKSFVNESVPTQASWVIIFWILFAFVLCLGLFYYRKKISRVTFLAALFAIPFLGELLVSLRRPIFFDRTLIWITIPVVLVLAAGIVQLRFRLLIIVVLGVLVTVNLLSASDYYKSMQKEDWFNPAGFVANFVQKDTLILFNATWAQIPFDYYFIPYENQYFLQVEKHGVPVDLFDRGTFEPKMTENDVPRLVALLEGHKMVWLVYSHYQATDPQGLIPQTIASHLKLVYQRDYYQVQLQLYVAP